MTLRVTLDPAALDAPGKQPTALAVSAERTRRRIMYSLDEVQTAILNHTALKLAGLKGTDYQRALEYRRSEVTGMLELARRINHPLLLRFLMSHHDALMRLMAE